MISSSWTGSVEMLSLFLSSVVMSSSTIVISYLFPMNTISYIPQGDALLPAFAGSAHCQWRGGPHRLTGGPVGTAALCNCSSVAGSNPGQCGQVPDGHWRAAELPSSSGLLLDWGLLCATDSCQSKQYSWACQWLCNPAHPKNNTCELASDYVTLSIPKTIRASMSVIM